MTDHQACFRACCEARGLSPALSLAMPEGFETAFGVFDPATETVFLNAELLRDRPEHEGLFHLFHELRHAEQYLRPERFDRRILRSCLYAIQYDGVCFRLVHGAWRSCRLPGSEREFTEYYLCQPHERDANRFAYEETRARLGSSPELEELYAFWSPKREVPDEVYEALYRKIDEAVFS